MPMVAVAGPSASRAAAGRSGRVGRGAGVAGLPVAAAPLRSCTGAEGPHVESRAVVGRAAGPPAAGPPASPKQVRPGDPSARTCGPHAPHAPHEAERSCIGQGLALPGGPRRAAGSRAAGSLVFPTPLLGCTGAVERLLEPHAEGRAGGARRLAGLTRPMRRPGGGAARELAALASRIGAVEHCARPSLVHCLAGHSAVRVEKTLTAGFDRPTDIPVRGVWQLEA